MQKSRHCGSVQHRCGRAADYGLSLLMAPCNMENTASLSQAVVPMLGTRACASTQKHIACMLARMRGVCTYTHDSGPISSTCRHSVTVCCSK